VGVNPLIGRKEELGPKKKGVTLFSYREFQGGLGELDAQERYRKELEH